MIIKYDPELNAYCLGFTAGNARVWFAKNVSPGAAAEAVLGEETAKTIKNNPGHIFETKILNIRG